MLVVAVQDVELELHLHADAEVARVHALRDLPEHHDAVVVELDRRERVRLERVGRDEGRRWCVVVLGVRPHPAPSRQRARLEHVGVAVGVGARGRAGREHHRAARLARGADQLRGVGVDREPPVDGRNLASRIRCSRI